MTVPPCTFRDCEKPATARLRFGNRWRGDHQWLPYCDKHAKRVRKLFVVTAERTMAKPGARTTRLPARTLGKPLATVCAGLSITGPNRGRVCPYRAKEQVEELSLCGRHARAATTCPGWMDAQG
mgnify:CR=1 FL=1